jgi:hypothetical protein
MVAVNNSNFLISAGYANQSTLIANSSYRWVAKYDFVAHWSHKSIAMTVPWLLCRPDSDRLLLRLM